ncbi:MAG: nucleotidyltransferase [Gammaproteobacteria bacterium]|nr:nucleotidyltransferase [Gammaproteobacteria bacterium]
MTELNRLLQLLSDADVPFVVVGGFAGMLHGSSLVTRDLDVCAVLTDENVARLRHALRDIHPTHRFTPQRLSFLDNPQPGVSVRNLYLQTDLGPVDILTSITGVGDFERVASAAQEVQLFGRGVRVMSVGDLIAAKEALGREKDLLAARELRAIQEVKKD